MVISRRIGSVTTEKIESRESQKNIGPKTMPGSIMLVGRTSETGPIRTIQVVDIARQDANSWDWLDRMIKVGNNSSEEFLDVRLTDHLGVCLNFPVDLAGSSFDREALIRRIESSPKLKTIRP